MKESVYNVYLLDEKERKYIVYNIMHDSIIRIDDEVYNLMKKNRINYIGDSVMEVLKNAGIVVDNNLNELDMLKIRFNRKKYNAVSMNFTIIPTHACNLACKYCYQGHGDILSNTMNEKTIKQTVEFIKKTSLGRKMLGVNFYGGEPLLFPDIAFGILEELKKFTDENNIHFLTTFTSNGTLFTEKIVEKLKNYNHEVQITLCGPKEIHDTTRIDKKGNGTYEKLMDVIELFKKHGIAFHIRVDVDQNNYDTVRSLLEDLKRRGYDGLYIAFCPICKDFCYVEIEWETKEVDAVSLAHLSVIAHDMGFGTNPIQIHDFVKGCSALSDNFLAIDPHGDVYKCIAAPNYTEHRIGTLTEDGDFVCINYETYCKWTLRDPLLIKECAVCKFSPICGGGCAMSAYSRNGDINTPGCSQKELGEVLRTFIMQEYPQFFEGGTYETIIL